MKILLLGDYSNVHHTLGEGLRALGHEVTVASDGDSWKDYPRDIDLKRRSLPQFLWTLLRRFPSFRGYDVVQLINPVFLSLKAERLLPFYRYLRQHNGKVFLAAYGMDHYWVKAGLDGKTFRYSDFNLGTDIRRSEENDVFIRDWLHGAKGVLNRVIAEDCDGIVAGLYEYYASYAPEYGDKLSYIPFPIRQDLAGIESEATRLRETPAKVRFFIGIQPTRHIYKGTDVMLRALERVKRTYPEHCEIIKVESVPFAQYRKLMLDAHVLLDQLYSYTPAMNALEAMARGLVVVGGAEPEYYALQGERELRPIVNVLPTEEDVFQKLSYLVEHREELPRLSAESQAFIRRHHDYKKVAQRYLDVWNAQKNGRTLL